MAPLTVDQLEKVDHDFYASGTGRRLSWGGATSCARGRIQDHRPEQDGLVDKEIYSS